MNILVCVKQIPDPVVPGALNPQHQLDRSGKILIDPADTYGVEAALQLIAQVGQGEVVLASMAPGGETSGIKTGLAMGAARAILVSDPALAGSDALSTAKVLAKCVQRAGDIDLVITATESTDGYTGTLPVMIAELLDWPALTFSTKVEISDGKVLVRRQTESGYDEVIAPLPAVISVTASGVEPRFASFKGIMGARNKPLDIVTLAELGIDAANVGWAGARQVIAQVESAPTRAAGEKFEDDGTGSTGAEKIIDFLEQHKVV